MNNPPKGTAQWWKNGDHPKDKSVPMEITDDDGNVIGIGDLTEGKVVRRYRHPDADGHDLCGLCSQAWDVHGWIDEGTDGLTVHPGDWVTTGRAPHHTYRRNIWGEYEEVPK